MFNFKEVNAAEGSAMSNDGKYLRPGMYRLNITEAIHNTTGIKGTPYMEISFMSHSSKLEYNEKIGKAKFYLTSGAIDRVQYLHEAYFGKKLEKTFKDTNEIVTYFDTIFKSESGKKLKKPFIVGGSLNEDGSRIYVDLPYSGYIISEDKFEEQEFEVNSQPFKSVITSKNKIYKPDVPTSNSDILESSSILSNDSDTKLPWD